VLRDVTTADVWRIVDALLGTAVRGVRLGLERKDGLGAALVGWGGRGVDLGATERTEAAFLEAMVAGALAGMVVIFFGCSET
jgi:hypothetical protein